MMLVFLFVALWSCASLVCVFLIEYVGGHSPCILCIYERMPYAIMIACSLFGAFSRYKKSALILIGACIVAQICLSSYHVMVEHKIIAEHCKTALDFSHLSEQHLIEQIQSAAVIGCSNPAIRVLGFSLAELNLIAQFCGCVVCWILIKRK